MRRILSRRDRQLEKMEIAASRGLNHVTLQLYSNEAARWAKKGFNVKKEKNEEISGMYTITFCFPELLNSTENTRFITGIYKNPPKYLSHAEILYLLSQKAIFDESFID